MEQTVREQTISKHLTLYSDGGARGNPGPAATACLITAENGQVLMEKSSYIGLRTNNQAEYEALIMALEAALSLGAEEVTCYLDSELVTKQLRGDYAVKNPELQRLWSKTYTLCKQFKNTNFITVPRTNNQIQKADKLVNEALDKEAK